MIDTRQEFTDGHRRCHRAAAHAVPAARHPGHGDRDLRHITRHAAEVARATSSRIPRVALFLLVFDFAGLAPPAFAEPVPLNARVVWVNETRVYIASADSLALEPGDLVTLAVGGHIRATGTIERLIDRDVALVILSSGSLDHLTIERIRVLAERVARPIPAGLRIGFPSNRRASLLFRCDQVSFRPSALAGGLVDTLSSHAFRIVRVSVPGSPETLLVRLFDESADEEIALERGELDLAVFWPGEASVEMRSPPWNSFPTRAHGVVEAAWSEAIRQTVPLLRLAVDFARLDRDLFRGDLGLSAGNPLEARDSAATPLVRVRFQFNPASPGRSALERTLNRGHRPGPDHEGTGIIRLRYVPVNGVVVWSEKPLPDGAGPAFDVPCRAFCREGPTTPREKWLEAADLLDYHVIIGRP